MICPVNRPEYEQGLPGSNRRLRFWRPLCFRLHQAPLNIPDRIRTCTAGTGIRYGHPFHHGDKALPKRFELLYDSLEGCCSYSLSYGNMMRPQAAFSVFSTIIISFMVTPNRMLKARRLSSVGSTSPRNHLYMFDLSLISRTSLIFSAEYPFSFAILFIFFPVSVRLMTGKFIAFSSNALSLAKEKPPALNDRR